MGEIISALTALAEGPAVGDLMVWTDVSDTTQAASGTTKKNEARYGVGAHVNAQTGTTYTYLTTDFRKLVTHTNAASIAGTLPQASATFPAGWYMLVQNRGAGVLTITPTTSTIDGAATLVLNQNEGAIVVSDGTNYFTLRGKATGAAGVGDVVGPSSSVASEFALFDGTTGKLIKRATGSGFVKATSGVYSTEANPTTGLPFEYAVAVSDETTSITTGTAKITFYFPVAVNITGVSAGLTGQSTSGAVTIDVNKNGTTIFSTNLTIDANEDTSHTAATPAALSSSPTAFSVTDKVTIDIDGAGTSAEGLKVSFTGTRQ